MTADFVVAESLRGIDAGKLFVIPGWRYRLVVAATKWFPDALLRRAYIQAAGRRNLNNNYCGPPRLILGPSGVHDRRTRAAGRLIERVC